MGHGGNIHMEGVSSKSRVKVSRSVKTAVIILSKKTQRKEVGIRFKKRALSGVGRVPALLRQGPDPHKSSLVTQRMGTTERICHICLFVP